MILPFVKIDKILKKLNNACSKINLVFFFQIYKYFRNLKKLNSKVVFFSGTAPNIRIEYRDRAKNPGSKSMKCFCSGCAWYKD